MSRGYWGYLFALIGIAILGAGIGYYHAALNYPQEERYPKYRYTRDEKQSLELGSIPQPKSLEYTEPCKEPNGRDDSQLCAEWRAAKAGEDSALWAKRGVWLTAIGAIGLLVTIAQSKIALNRAKDSNEIARDTARHQLRAYLALHDPEIKIENDIWIARMAIRNHGPTPARHVKIYTKHSLPGFRWDERAHEPEIIDPSSQESITIDLGADWLKNFPHNVKWEVVVVIDYTDIFDNSWRRHAERLALYKPNTTGPFQIGIHRELTWERERKPEDEANHFNAL